MSKAEVVTHQTTLHIRDTCLCLLTHRSARVLARRFDEALREVGLTHGQFSLMNALNRPQPAAMPSVATLLDIDRTTLTAALKPLARRGLVEVRADPGDGRRRLLSLTREGHRVLARAVPRWKRAHAQLEAQLGEGAAQLRGYLESLRYTEAH